MRSPRWLKLTAADTGGKTALLMIARSHEFSRTAVGGVPRGIWQWLAAAHGCQCRAFSFRTWPVLRRRGGSRAGRRAAPVIVFMSARDAGGYGGQFAASPVAGFLVKDHLSGAVLGGLLAGDRP